MYSTAVNGDALKQSKFGSLPWPSCQVLCVLRHARDGATCHAHAVHGASDHPHDVHDAIHHVGNCGGKLDLCRKACGMLRSPGTSHISLSSHPNLNLGKLSGKSCPGHMWCGTAHGL